MSVCNTCTCQIPTIGPSLSQTCYGGTYVLFMALLNNYITKTCIISEMCERVKPRENPDDSYDFIVIGSGSSGSAAAGRLAEIPKLKVLLLEAGHDEPPGSQVPSMVSSFIGNKDMDWSYKIEPSSNACLGKPQGRCTWPRGKVLGGCSVINGMMYMRGVPKDYDNWRDLGNKDWGFKDVITSFKKSENNLEIGTKAEQEYHGKGGPMDVKTFNDHPEFAEDILKAAKEIGYSAGHDLNGKEHSGFTIAQAVNKNGARVSSARAFVRPQRNNPNLHVMLNSTVTKIIIDTKNGKKTASAVEFVYKNKKYVVKARKEVILSAGAVNSPQLLLLSGVGPKVELDKVGIKQVHELSGVGKNLHNHVTFYLTYLLKKVKDINDLDWAKALDYILYQKGPLSSTGLSQVTARLSTKYETTGEFPDLQIFFSGYLANCAQSGQVDAYADPKNPDAPKHIGISPVNLHPKSRGYLTLKSNNPLDPPLIYANYLTEPQDLDILVEGIRVIQNLTNTKTLKEKYGIEYDKEEYGNCSKVYKYDSDDYWKCALRFATGPENHQAGSCKMGPSSDKLAVVNNELEVYGISGLRVVDASIMPAVVSGNTHATCVMIAEKAVDYIKKKWWQKPGGSSNYYTVSYQQPAAVNNDQNANKNTDRNNNNFSNRPPNYYQYDQTKGYPENRHKDHHQFVLNKRTQYDHHHEDDGQYRPQNQNKDHHQFVLNKRAQHDHHREDDGQYRPQHSRQLKGSYDYHDDNGQYGY